MGKTKAGLIQEMVERVKQDSLPAFSKSITHITSIANGDDADLEKLSESIKKDPALSVQILKACNGVYRTRRGRVNTISRALVMLGVEEVKKICLGCWLIEDLTKGNPPKELTDEMSMAFYSATQARLFSLLRGDPFSEEVFLSALMLNIGPMAMWKLAEEEMQEVARVVKDKQCPVKQAEEEVFGFTMQELSRALAQAWDLEQFIPLSKEPTKREELRYNDICLSTDLVRSLPYGWKSKMVGDVLDEIEDSLTASAERIEAVIRDAADEMQEMASSFGIAPIGDVIEAMPEILSAREATKVVRIDVPTDAKKEQEETALPEETQEKEEFVPVEANKEFQLESLQNMSALMMSGAKPTMFILHAMGGMHRGIGLDRVVFAILNDSRTKISGRIAIGPEQEEMKANFAFDLSPEIQSVFQHAFASARPLWAGQLDQETAASYGVEKVNERLQGKDFFLGPIVVSNKWVGMFYADMKVSGRELSIEAFNAFNQFTNQATLAFQHLDFMKQNASRK